MIFTTNLEKYPYSSLALLLAAPAKLANNASQYSVNCLLRFSIICISLHNHYFSDTSPTSNCSPSSNTSILLPVKFFHGMFILKQPIRLCNNTKGKLSFLITSALNLTLRMTTSPDHIPIFRFSELKFSKYSPNTLFSNLSTMD